jgi:DNA-directed RNA polymerase subunit RPC12/RpoP
LAVMFLLVLNSFAKAIVRQIPDCTPLPVQSLFRHIPRDIYQDRHTTQSENSGCGSLDRIEVKCPNCGYKKDLLVGGVGPDQTLSDLNEDYACYKLHYCPDGKEIMSIDIHNREFDGHCPEHDVELKPLEKVPQECPKCGGKLSVREREILEAGGEES